MLAAAWHRRLCLVCSLHRCWQVRPLSQRDGCRQSGTAALAQFLHSATALIMQL